MTTPDTGPAAAKSDVQTKSETKAKPNSTAPRKSPVPPVGDRPLDSSATGAGGPEEHGEPEGHVQVVRVVGPEKGRRRADRRFGPEPTDIPLADLSEDDLQALRRDPALIVSIGAVPSEATAED
ncbi:hypothetical protein [Pseudotabrizicola algicola]|uniref:Mu-like prophage FluMu N-terminal domain-containing protein n=1 Tax=Pseudotabrizicola algicola TaxID=2709381 RepID=A0A6B3RR25_9RHOB|nr:hypothetical protein [Pseudotabrizicola algicola]NEX47606.1 hypothetical protein [Pseudotabrizicola algicola]